MRLHWLSADSGPDDFPDVNRALRDPPGLLAAGGDLSVDRLLAAYRRGIFPWYEEGQPILWWSPDPRTVLYPDDLHRSRSLLRTLRRGTFTTTFDRDFAAVIDGCTARRQGQSGTWITAEMAYAYRELHRHGAAHSVEVWRQGQLAGGIYGVSVGRVFFGESMFSRVSDASKVALVTLVEQLRLWNFGFLDCQFPTAHLTSMGARSIPRSEFVTEVRRLCAEEPDAGAWRGQTG